jgi:Fungal chitosanase of glycosyl hydrolase group 75
MAHWATSRFGLLKSIRKMTVRLPYLGLFVALSWVQMSAQAASTCQFIEWQTFRGTKIYKHKKMAAYFYQPTHLAIDADGAPNAYGPNDSGLDINVHAGYPGTDWWPTVLVPDPLNPLKPYIQPTGKHKGMYVSMTHLKAPGGSPTDPLTYVNAVTVPYLVFPTGFGDLPGVGWMGDFAMARSKDKLRTSAAIIADSGGGATPPLGEISVKLANALGGKNVNPRNGAGQPASPITYVVFPNSRNNPVWPVTPSGVEKRGAALLASIGGWSAIDACVSKHPA